MSHHFKVGDLVDIIYDHDMATHGIAFDIIKATMEENPYIIRRVNGRIRPSYYLEGSTKIWPFWMVQFAKSREPDWEI